MGRGLRLLSVGAFLPALAAQQPPPFTHCRSDEDHSYLADAELRGGAWWEPLAFVPLARDGRAWLGTGLEVRLRYEAYRNDAWSPAPEADHDYVWWRVLPHVSWNRPEGRVFAQLLLAGETGDEAGTSALDEDRADVLQAFAELGDASATLELRAGRQLLSYGSERLIGPRYGPNVLQAFDAARLTARPSSPGERRCCQAACSGPRPEPGGIPMMPSQRSSGLAGDSTNLGDTVAPAQPCADKALARTPT